VKYGLSYATLVVGVLMPGALMLVGCGAEADPEDVCTVEKFACEDQTDGFVRPDRCKVEGDLQVTIGQGEAEFMLLSEGELPPIHTSGQGGFHTFVALRIANVDLEQSPTIRVRYQLVYHLATGPCAGGVVGTGATEDCDLIQGSRDLILGSKQPIGVRPDGTVEEFGILLFVDAAPPGAWTLRLEVEDGCARLARVEHKLLTTEPLQQLAH
jgi:hypothetical protein